MKQEQLMKKRQKKPKTPQVKPEIKPDATSHDCGLTYIVLRSSFGYSLPDKDFGLRYQSESSTRYQFVRLTRIPPSGLAKIII